MKKFAYLRCSIALLLPLTAAAEGQKGGQKKKAARQEAKKDGAGKSSEQQEKRAACSDQAAKKGLKGPDRKAFMKSCTGAGGQQQQRGKAQ